MEIRPSLLIVEDAPDVQRMLLAIFKRDHTVMTANNGNEALDLLKQEKFDCVVTDYRMPGMDGIEFLQQARQILPGLPIVMLTAHATVENAVNAMRLGAFNYLTKPVNVKELKSVVKEAVEKSCLLHENQALRAELEHRKGLSNLVGRSRAMQEVFTLVRSAGENQAPVMFLGETGTGRETLAQAMHYLQGGSGKPFVRFDCSSLPELMQESELFGHERDAFAGALTRKRGKLELAAGGTLLIREAGKLAASVQQRLLNALTAGKFTRMGGQEEVPVNARIVSCATETIADQLSRGQFNKDLYYRLAVIPVHVPPLRERVEDIPALVNHFIEKYAAKNGRTVRHASPDAISKLLAHSWPGNVGELENAIEYAVVVSSSDTVRGDDIPLKQMRPVIAHTSGQTLDDALSEPEKQILLDALQKNQWSRKKTADMLGITRATLYNKMKKYNIQEL